MGGVLRNRWLIFAIALGARCVVAFVFFGSVDMRNVMTDAEHLLGGVRPSELGVPYLPGVQIVIWAAGLIAFHSALPVTFVFKLAGCLFDAAIAALLVDVRGARAGWLYAFAPVPILIFAIHGQWDSIPFALIVGSLLLLRREGSRPAAFAGALFVLAAIVKPVAVPLAPFFLERKRLGAILGGMAACFLVWLAVLWAIGDPLSVAVVDHVYRYARGGVTYFGAPFAFGVRQNRMLVLLPLLVLVPLSWKGRIAREDAALFFYAFTLATCGLSVQYLAWLVPFVLMRGHERFAAVYSLVAGVFLVTFYVSPFGGFLGYNFENLGGFAPLRGAAWLTPEIANAPMRLQIVRTLGDVVLPLACAAFLVGQLRRRRDAGLVLTAPPSVAPLGVALAALAVMVAVAWPLPRPAPEAFARRMEAKIGAYNVESYQPPMKDLKQAWVVPLGPRTHWFTATNLAYVWIGSWCLVAALPLRRTEARGEAGVSP